MPKILLIFILLSLSACSAQANPTAQPTASATPLWFVTATLVPTFTARPSATTPSSPTPPPPPTADANQTALPTAVPPSSTPAANTARAKAQIFVRSGPAQAYASLGTLEAGTLVKATGRSINNVWVQIEFPAGAQGLGWVASAFLQEANLAGLPYFDSQGRLISAGTPAADSGGPSLTPTVYSAAPADGDSEQKPAVQISFAPDGTREFTFSSELSSPNGDASDWVAFTPYEPDHQATYVYFKLECSGNGGITAVLEQAGLPVPEVKPLLCGNYDFAVRVIGGQEYILVLNADGAGSALRFVSYTLHVRSQR